MKIGRRGFMKLASGLGAMAAGFRLSVAQTASTLPESDARSMPVPLEVYGPGDQLPAYASGEVVLPLHQGEWIIGWVGFYAGCIIPDAFRGFVRVSPIDGAMTFFLSDRSAQNA